MLTLALVCRLRNADPCGCVLCVVYLCWTAPLSVESVIRVEIFLRVARARAPVASG